MARNTSSTRRPENTNGNRSTIHLTWINTFSLSLSHLSVLRIVFHHEKNSSLQQRDDQVSQSPIMGYEGSPHPTRNRSLGMCSLFDLPPAFPMFSAITRLLQKQSLISKLYIRTSHAIHTHPNQNSTSALPPPPCTAFLTRLSVLRRASKETTTNPAWYR